MVFAAMLLASGCGGGDALQGTWSREEGPCTSAVNYDHGNYDAYTTCPLQGGGSGSEVVLGVYSLNGRQVTETSQESSCPGTSGSNTLTYTINGNSLKLDDSSGTEVLIYDPNPPTIGANTIGCFNFDGTFTPHDVVPLQ
jgi:hypothetical protein